MALRDLAAQLVDGACDTAIHKYLQQLRLADLEPSDPEEISKQAVHVPEVGVQEQEEERVSWEEVQAGSANPASPRAVDTYNEVKSVAFEPGMLADLVQTFTAEIITSALENVAARCVPTPSAAAVAVGDTNDTPQEIAATAEEETASNPGVVVAQPKRPVSRRQLIHQVAKCTNDQVLAAVLQSVAAVRQTVPTPEIVGLVETPDVELERENGSNHSPSSQILTAEVESPPAAEVEESSEQLEGLSAQVLGNTAQIPPLNLQQLVQPPQASASVSTDSAAFIRSQVTHSFVHALLLEAAAASRSSFSWKPQMSIKVPPPLEQQESLSSAHNSSRRKSPNVHKRNLVKKDSATSALTPTTPPVRPQQQSPSPPSTPPSADEVDIPSDEFAPAVAAVTDLLEPTEAQFQSQIKAKSKRDAARPKHHSHKAKEKPAATASGISSDGGKGEVPTRTPSVSTAKLSKLPLEELGLFRASASPLSSGRLAQEIYKPRQKNPQLHAGGIESSSSLSTPAPAKKPSHSRRHPHHIQNATIAKETSYSRDSPRADAIAAELTQQKAKKSSAKTTGASPDSLSSHVLLPLATKVPALPVSSSVVPKDQSPAQSPTSTKPSKEKKHKSSPTRMRSGYCQQCVFEGRSCKINDCLKHQLLK